MFVDDIVKLFKEYNLIRKQKKIDRKYELYGLTGEVLEEQIALNIERNKLDIPDANFLDDDGFSQ